MEEITIEHIKTRLKNREISLYKTFEFSIEDLQDRPGENLVKIKEYLNKHKEHFSDFKFHSKTDETTFKPMLTVQLLLNEKWKKNSKEQYEKLINFIETKK